jgi:hypothetical protein
MTESAIRAILQLRNAAPRSEWCLSDDEADSDHYEITAVTDNGGGCMIASDVYPASSARFIVAAYNDMPRLCDAALYALELERIVHDIQRGEAADLIAEARRRGRGEMADALLMHSAVVTTGTIRLASRYLPPLPAEPPTNRELRERCETLEAENARLRAGLQKVATAVTADGWAGTAVREALAFAREAAV